MENQQNRLQITEDIDLLPWQECMQLRKIPIKEGPDVLRWGHSTSGIFSVKEAYHLTRKLLKTKSPKQSGAKSGNLFSGPRSPFFFGSQLKTVSSLGTISLRKASQAPPDAPFVNKVRKPWNTSSTIATTVNRFGIGEPKPCDAPSGIEVA
jgi:hypothetical protein